MSLHIWLSSQSLRLMSGTVRPAQCQAHQLRSCGQHAQMMRA